MGDETGEVGTRSTWVYSLADDEGQPNLIIDSPASNSMIWTLQNNTQDDLIVQPFAPGQVDKNHYHFKFDFQPGTLTARPAIRDWNVAFEMGQDLKTIAVLYVAYAGKENLVIKRGDNPLHQWTLSYSGAIQTDKYNATVSVPLTAGTNVMLGNKKLTGSYNTTLNLVHSNLAASPPPISVDFVGRRSVLNDGKTSSSLTFALTNMMSGNLSLSPSSTSFTVWFDASPDWYQAAPTLKPEVDFHKWAMADVQSIGSMELHLPPSWTKSNSLVHGLKDEASSESVPTVSAHWTLQVSEKLDLQPQQPVLFTFTGLISDLVPGISRMYLQYQGVPGFSDGVLIAEMEKTPLIYGPGQGQGLYLSLGTSTGDTPPAPTFDGGLYINQLGNGPAATFANASAGRAWQFLSESSGNLRIQEISSANPAITVQSDGLVGIGTPTPQEKLHVDGNLYVDGGRTFVGFDPGGFHWIRQGGDDESKSVFIGLLKDSEHNTVRAVQLFPGGVPGLMVENTGCVCIGDVNPRAKLGVVVSESDTSTDILRVSKGASDGLVVRNDGTVHVGEYKPAATPLVVNGRIQSSAVDGGIWLSDKADGFVGNNGSNIGFFTNGTGVGWNAFQINKLTGNVGIGTDSPRTRLDVLLADTDGGTDLLRVRKGSVNYLTMLNDGKLNASGKVELGDTSKDPKIDGDLVVHGKIVCGDLICTGQLSAWNPIDMNTGSGGWCKLTYGRPSGWSDYATWVQFKSDKRLKEDIRPIADSLEKVKRLQGVLYRWSEAGRDYLTQPRANAVTAGPDASDEYEAEERQEAAETLSGDQLGLIAQEVEAVVPEVVVEDKDGHKTIRYHQLVALLIEAMKEQSQIVDDLSRRVAALTST